MRFLVVFLALASFSSGTLAVQYPDCVSGCTQSVNLGYLKCSCTGDQPTYCLKLNVGQTDHLSTIDCPQTATSTGTGAKKPLPGINPINPKRAR